MKYILIIKYKYHILSPFVYILLLDGVGEGIFYMGLRMKLLQLIIIGFVLILIPIPYWKQNRLFVYQSITAFIEIKKGRT